MLSSLYILFVFDMSQQQQQQYFPPMDLSQNDGCSIMHSFPFINDGPKSNHRHSYHPSSQYQQQQLCPIEKPELTRHVPPGVIHIKPTWKPVKLDEKPPFSYATIIAHAILSSESRKLTLSEIYQWISEQYPCYSMTDHRWQVKNKYSLILLLLCVNTLLFRTPLDIIYLFKRHLSSWSAMPIYHLVKDVSGLFYPVMSNSSLIIWSKEAWVAPVVQPLKSMLIALAVLQLANNSVNLLMLLLTSQILLYSPFFV